MSDLRDLPDDTALDELAAAWLCERAEGFTSTRAREFSAWREISPRHGAAVARVERALALLDEMPAVRSALELRFPTDEVSTAPATTTHARRPTARFPVWIAGLAAVFAIMALAWWQFPANRPVAEHYEATSSAPRRLELADGSVIDLNAGGEVRVELSPHDRRVTLTSGEAHFAVAKDSARPFIVSAGGVAVRAVGTAFNVRLAATSVDVLVVEGKVEVARGGSPSASLVTSRPPVVAAGERTRVSREYTEAIPPPERIDPAEIRTALAWQDRITSFTDVPLRELVERFNRRNAIQLVLGDAELGARKIGGVIALDQVEAFVRLLEQEGDIVSERRPSGEIVLRGPR